MHSDMSIIYLDCQRKSPVTGVNMALQTKQLQYLFIFIIENFGTNQIIDRNLSTHCQQMLEDA